MRNNVNLGDHIGAGVNWGRTDEGNDDGERVRGTQGQATTGP